MKTYKIVNEKSEIIGFQTSGKKKELSPIHMRINVSEDYRYNDYKYICNHAVEANLLKSTDIFENVTCKNCLKILAKNPKLEKRIAELEAIVKNQNRIINELRIVRRKRKNGCE